MKIIRENQKLVEFMQKELGGFKDTSEILQWKKDSKKIDDLYIKLGQNLQIVKRLMESGYVLSKFEKDKTYSQKEMMYLFEGIITGEDDEVLAKRLGLDEEDTFSLEEGKKVAEAQWTGMITDSPIKVEYPNELKIVERLKKRIVELKKLLENPKLTKEESMELQYWLRENTMALGE